MSAPPDTSPAQPLLNDPGLLGEASDAPEPGLVRVDLLPPSARRGRGAERAKRWAARLIGLGIVVLLALYGWAWNDARLAQAQLDEATGRAASLDADVEALAAVPATYDAAQVTGAVLADAMGSEVRWSFLLNELGFSTPSGVSLRHLEGESASSQAQAVPSPEEVSPVGDMTFLARAGSFDDVAGWLDSLESLNDYRDPWVGDAVRRSLDLSFDSGAELTDRALSGRYGLPPAVSDPAEQGTDPRASGTPGTEGPASDVRPVDPPDSDPRTAESATGEEG